MPGPIGWGYTVPHEAGQPRDGGAAPVWGRACIPARSEGVPAYPKPIKAPATWLKLATLITEDAEGGETPEACD